MLQKRIVEVWKNYFVGQLLITAFISFATWGAGALTGLKFPMINAILAGICENIPNIGPIVSGIISAVFALVFGSSRFEMANWQFMLLTIGICILIQLLQNWLIGPLVIGKKMDMNPIVVILGMTLFSLIFGIWGMILAVPIIGTIREIYRYYNPSSNSPGDKEKKAAEDRLQPLQ